jgi:hypothetical protein
MTIATDLLQRHFETLVEDTAQWQTLIADDILWELAYAPALVCGIGSVASAPYTPTDPRNNPGKEEREGDEGQA